MGRYDENSCKEPSPLTREEISKTIEDEVTLEILYIFEELLQRVWKRIALVLGPTATAAIFRSSARSAAGDYAFLEHVKVDEAGVDLRPLWQHLEDVDREALRSGLLCFMDEVIVLLTDLTGNIMAPTVQTMIDRFAQKLEEE